MRIGTTIGIAVAVTVIPVVVHAQPPSEPPLTPVRTPETYTVYDAWNAPVFATGALVFIGSYAASAVVAGTSDHTGADRLYVPVAGPWLALDAWGACPIDEPRCDRDTAQKVLLVADGVFQAAGLITMLTGIVSPSFRTFAGAPRTVDKARSRPRHATLKPTRNGLAVVGKF